VLTISDSIECDRGSRDSVNDLSTDDSNRSPLERRIYTLDRL
jgi:hypothetical protein